MPAITEQWLLDQIEDLYRTIQVPEAIFPGLRERLAQEIELCHAAVREEHARLEKLRRDVKSKQAKLMEAFYNEALPVDMLAKEQRVLGDELASVERRLKSYAGQEEDERKLLELALNLAKDCHRLYYNSDDLEKRMLNQLFFDKIFVCTSAPGNKHPHALTEAPQQWRNILAAAERRDEQDDAEAEHEKTRSCDLAGSENQSSCASTRISRSTMVPPVGLEPTLRGF